MSKSEESSIKQISFQYLEIPKKLLKRFQKTMEKHLLRTSFYKTVSVPVSGISSQRPIKIGLLRFKNLENSAD